MTTDLKCRNISIEGTNVCTAKCIFCPREQYKHKLRHMPQEIFNKIIDEAAELGLESIGFGGFGEPLCDPGFMKKVSYAKKKISKLDIQVTSTLFLLNEKLTQYIIKNIDTTHVSFYGMSPETYKNIHGGSLTFEKSKENILRLIEQKRILKSKHPKIIMKFLINEINESEIEQFIAFWEPIVDEVMVWKPHNYLYGRKYRKVDVSNQASCGRPFTNLLYFDIDGRATICCFDFNKELEVGNIKHQTIKEILTGEKLKKLRDLHRDKQYSNLICKSCDQRFLDQDVLVYSTNKNRKVRELSMSRCKY